MDNIKEKVRVAAGKSLDQDDSLSIGPRSGKAVKVSLAVVLPGQLRNGGEDDVSAGSLLPVSLPSHPCPARLF